MASCPLDFQATIVDSEQQMTLQHVQQIEEHVAAYHASGVLFEMGSSRIFIGEERIESN